MAKGIVTDVEKCLGCRSCELACAVAHSQSGELEGALKESPRPQPRVTVEMAGEFGVPMQCRHCEDAPCITVCPTGAISREDANSPVVVSQDECIGCRYCLVVCPFGVIAMSRDGKAIVKCDLCVERLRRGEEPACVAACPTGALSYADEADLATEKRRRAARELALAAQT